jgi:cytochrome b subunit of formate dehydrogenase
LAGKQNRSARDIDLTSFGFVSSCGGCHPGGGPLEEDRDGKRYDRWMADPASGFKPGGDNGLDGDYFKARWSETGVVEADCLLCHQPDYDHGGRNAHLQKLNFRWAATAGSRLAQVQGAVAEGKPPTVTYDQKKFNPDGTVTLHTVRQPRNTTCLSCHAKSDWKKRGAAYSARTDVHLAKGMRCVDCHTAGSRASDPRIRGREVHQIGKGDDPGGFVRDDLDDTVRSCESCHRDGTHGAPISRHAGLPPLHLDRIACQTCHIPWRHVRAAAVQASDVHNPGPHITPPGKHIWTFYDAHRVYWNHYGENTLSKPSDQPTDRYRPELAWYRGKIYPVNRVHSAFVGYEEEGRPGLGQLAMKDFYSMWAAHLKDPKTVYPELARITDDDRDGMIEVNRPEEIDALLAATTAHLQKVGFPLAGRRLVWVANERVHRSGREYRALRKAEWEASPFASTFKYSHDVAPARAALGAGGCSDCHSADSPFFFGAALVRPFGPDGRPVWTTRSRILGYDGSPRRYSGLAGGVAAFFKWLTVLVMGLLLGHIGLDLARRLRRRKPPAATAPTVWVQRLNLHFRAQHLLLVVAVVMLAISGLFTFGARFPGAAWAATLTGALGGLDVWRLVHRAGAALLVAAALYHLLYSLLHEDGRRDFRLMLPTLTDFRHLGQNLRYLLGRAEAPPAFGRFSYLEKFDYWAVFWGCVIMIGTGLALWFPDGVRRVFPGASPAVFDAFKEAHAHEAVLAVLAIGIWHLYNVHLRPGQPWLSGRWLHGRMSREEVAEHHPADPVLGTLGETPTGTDRPAP